MANRGDGPRVIKKYGNRRLYDTRSSGYITLEELTLRIREGDDVTVLDAQSNEDLTQVTLTQLIIEGRGAARLLPVPLLTQLIRMGDEALAEFLGRYMAAALELYLRARTGAQSLGHFNPMATMPFTAADALARMMLSPAAWLSQNPFGFGAAAPAPAPAPPQYAPPPMAAPTAPGEEPEPVQFDPITELRKEVEALRRAVAHAPRAPKSPAKTARKKTAK